jgi:hypothetical protein
MIDEWTASILIAITPIVLTHIKFTVPHTGNEQIQNVESKPPQEYSTTKQEGWTCEYEPANKRDVLGDGAGKTIYAKPIFNPSTKTEECPKLRPIQRKVATEAHTTNDLAS